MPALNRRILQHVIAETLKAREHRAQQAVGALDLLTMGEPIGFGAYRLVYAPRIMPNYVVKIEYNENTSANRDEMQVWQRIMHTDLSKWFAPCVAISDNCQVLVQEKTVKPRPDEFPKRLPAFFTDFKRSNYGVLVGEHGKRGGSVRCFVCHDYANHLLMEMGMTDDTRVPKWRKE